MNVNCVKTIKTLFTYIEDKGAKINGRGGFFYNIIMKKET